MMHLSFLALSLAAALVEASRYSRDIPHRVKESINGPPHGWLKHGPAPSDHVLKLKIALHQPHFPMLEQRLREVSDPEHKSYGFYLSKEETEALMAPHPETLDIVSEWLSSHGIKEEHLYRSSAQDWVTIRAPVVLVEEMLDTKYDIYTHLESGEKIVRTTSYSVPESVYAHVELIQPTTMFTRQRLLKSAIYRQITALSTSSILSSPSTGTIMGPAGNEVDAGCNDTITINCLRQLYNMVGYNTCDNNGNKIAVTAYIGEYANNEDLQQFFQLQNPTAYGSNYTFISVNGGLNNQTPAAAGGEANLDTQIAYGLTHPTRATLYSTGGSPPYTSDELTPMDSNEPYSDWLNYVLSQESPPQTISTSYGDLEQTVPYTYATRVCAGFAALGARGVSLLFSSGDLGVGDGDSNPETQKCISNTNSNNTMFLPMFPVSCPFVTAVGSTRFIPEIASNFSGGGFSNYFSRPTYQDMAVSKYFEKLAPGTYEGLCNHSGRGYPDVAAQGEQFLIIFQGRQVYVNGTSCSAPTFASIVAMLNDARMNAGKPSLGFLNPWLYKIGYTALNDIMIGNNPGCGTDGFNATVGWDPVTGYGTPNFEKLLRLALAA